MLLLKIGILHSRFMEWKDIWNNIQNALTISVLFNGKKLIQLFLNFKLKVSKDKIIDEKKYELCETEKYLWRSRLQRWSLGGARSEHRRAAPTLTLVLSLAPGPRPSKTTNSFLNFFKQITTRLGLLATQTQPVTLSYVITDWTLYSLQFLNYFIAWAHSKHHLWCQYIKWQQRNIIKHR